MCIGGENYVETEEDYFLGYSETEQSGYDEGYADGRAGNNNKPEPGERLPNGEPTKKGYENGRKDGRYFGYIHGYSVGEYEEANPNG